MLAFSGEALLRREPVKAGLKATAVRGLGRNRVWACVQSKGRAEEWSVSRGHDCERVSESCRSHLAAIAVLNQLANVAEEAVPVPGCIEFAEIVSR